jgi:hypothetical protein
MYGHNEPLDPADEVMDMGLDVYVGPLTRYYRGDWSTIIQQMGAAGGVEVAVARPGQPPGEASDHAPGPAARPSEPTPPGIIWLDRIERWLNSLSRWGGTGTRAATAQPDAITAWRATLNQQVAGKIAEPLDWNESETVPYYTDKPDWVGYSCLLLLAAHAEYPDLPRPTQASDAWVEDPAWKLASRDDFAHTRYGHVLSPTVWLPCAFAAVFTTDDVSGADEVTIGSSVTLVAQLRELNERTYQGSADDLAAWLEAGPDFGPAGDAAVSVAVDVEQPGRQRAAPTPFDHTARFALALFLDLAEKSVAHRLPMMLDW